MRLADASTVASRLLAALAPACERIEVAGSIRRRKPEVKDIELVAVPKWRSEPVFGYASSLFDVPDHAPQRTRPVSVLAEAVRQLAETDALRIIKPGAAPEDLGAWHIDDAGKYYRLYVPARDIKVDLFVASRETWGPVFTYRTGSAEFSAALLARWKVVTDGGYSKDAQLYRPMHREPEALLEEADVFAACRVAFVPPEQRLDATAVHRAALGTAVFSLSAAAATDLDEASR